MKVVILRGLPGSGKSTWTGLNTTRATVCSADSFFVNDAGEYIFEPHHIGDAHNFCWLTFSAAVSRREPMIVVDNTNTQRWEYQRYMDAAEAAGYQVEVVSLFDGGLTDAELAARNVHGVPEATIAKMRARWEA